MHRRRFLCCMLAVAGTFAFSPAAPRAQEQPVRIVFPFAAGGSGDALARLMADKLRSGLNRTVIVENRTGAAGRIGVQAVKTAAPDGNTLLLTPIAPMAVFQHVYKPLGYDPVADFQPISQLGTFDFGVATGPSLTVATLKELVDWAKMHPAQANYGSPAAGALPHFLGVMFARAAGIDLRHVTYRGSAAALAALVAGQIPILFTTVADMAELHKAGRIRVLATSDNQRSPLLPEVPTLREAGYDLWATGWYGMFAPAKTPADVVERLNRVIVAAVKSPEIHERLTAFGLRPTGTSAGELAAIQKADSELWEPAVKASGFTPEQ
jgi:tripartite-type tricarboxylate transporter receptor subunit TctC